MKILLQAVLSVAFCCALSSASDRGGYILTAPGKLQMGINESLCVQLTDFSEDVYVQLRLIDNVTVLSEIRHRFQNGKGGCIDFPVPDLGEREKSWEKDDLEIVGVGQTTDQRFEGKTQVNLVQRKAGIIFIQTDKPIYKPGQLVRIRLLAVDDNLRPVKNPISVLLRNPLQVKLANWADQQSDYGLFDLEFQLSAEPVMGTWAIEASYKGTKYPTSFTVEEYVLPKYEVTVTPPSYLNPWTPMIDGKVCAKYTYGKPVVGRLRVEVCLDKRGYYYRHSDDDSNRACTQYIADISGCQPFSVNASLLGMALNTYSVWSAKVTYNASVLEEATGVTLYGAAETTAIRNQEVNIKFEDVSQYYKPGLPFAGKVVVTRPDNSAAPGEPIRVTARNYGTGMHFEGNFTTDYEGSFRFSLPPEASKDSFNLQASALRYERGTYSVRENHHSVSESRAYHYVKPWYSPSNSFLEISPVSDMVRCGGAVPVEVTYTSYPGTEYNFHYQILSRGNIVSTGSVSNKVDESRYTPQQYSFDNFVRITTTPPPPTTTPIPTTTTASNTTKPPSPPPSPPAKPPSPPAPPPRSFDGAPDKRKKRDTGDMKGPNSTVTARFNFTIPMTTAMSSGGKLLVYFVRVDREVVADYTEFKAESCVDNKVKMAFKQSTVRPGEPSTLQVTATPGSLCGIGVVDKSVLLLGGDNQLSIEKVVRTLNERDPMRYFYGYLDYRETNRYCLDQIGIPEAYKDEVNETMLRLSYEWFYDMPFSYQLQQTDSLEAFMKVGFVTATNLDIMTRPCSTYQRREYLYYDSDDDYNSGYGLRSKEHLAAPGSQPDIARSSVTADKTSVEVKGEEPQARTYFPETWLWDIEKVGENGVIELKREIPDTITEWVGRSVCTSAETGLGVSGSAKVTAFQSFFVSYTLPYSVIRGENIPVPVTIFNYLSECLAIEVSLDTASGEFLLDGEPVVTLCVCGQQSETHRYIITPSTIGSVNITVDARSVSDTGYCSNSLDMSEEGIGVRDIITQPLLVEPEGIPEEYTRSYFVCPSESVDKRFSQRIEMNTPDDVILDSARGYVTIIGDLMGPAMTNLDNLVRMPYGCGEQNMASFTPNIYVMQYLDSTNRLTPEIAEKAKNYMRIGYQRELRYRHPDGSYSSFGPNSWSKGEGSSWLTAFVVKSLAQARPYIYIDQEDLDRSIDFFKQTQNNETGCFRKVGQSSAYIKGGNEGQANSTLTAYILAALLEAHIEPEDDVVKNAVKCIENDDFTDIYTTALAAYALTLYDKGLPFRHKLLQTLKEKVIEEESQQHWERADKPKREKRPSWWWYPAPSAEVEITAYALLAFIAEEQEGGVLIGQPIVQWLSRQRNAYGGFSSTQDTVVALHALAEYGAIAYSDGLNMTVTVADEADQDLITVNLTDSGSLIPRRQRIDWLPTEVTVSATGNGCALIQANARYNVQGETPKDPAFDVEVKLYQSVVEPKNCDRQRMQVCAKFQVTSQVSNMAIIEAKMVTGWEPEVDSLKALIQEPKWGIRRYEIEKDIVNFYFDEMTAQKSCVYFEIIKKLEVNNTKPGRVRVYDYYEAEYSVVTSYEIDPNCNSYRWEPIWWWRGGLVDDVLEAVPLAETEPEKTATLCPVCPSGTPDDVESLFCNSSVAYKVQAGRGGKYLFKILADLRPTKDKTRFNKVFCNATLAEECSCDVIYEDTKVVVFGPEGAYDPESQLVRLDGSTTVVKLTDQLEKTLTKTTRLPECPKVE